jgi:hypothetical protein
MKYWRGAESHNIFTKSKKIFETRLVRYLEATPLSIQVFQNEEKVANSKNTKHYMENNKYGTKNEVCRE